MVCQTLFPLGDTNTQTLSKTVLSRGVECAAGFFLITSATVAQRVWTGFEPQTPRSHVMCANQLAK